MGGTSKRRVADRRDSDAPHVPVMRAEVLEAFRPVAEQGGWIVDGTLGVAGHAVALLEAYPRVRVLGVDQDDAALDEARARLVPFGTRARVLRGRLSELSRLVREELDVAPVGYLSDLGVSSLQLDRAERGFSFQADGPLDMRMDRRRPRTAADIVNRWDEADLADLFHHEGGEPRARAVARAIADARRGAPILRTSTLADLVSRAAFGPATSARIHPATRVFQALRRAVNEEGDELLGGLAAAAHGLASGGRLVVLAFHSGEDRVVKRTLQEGARAGIWTIETKKPIAPSRAELRDNPRARSARLRVATRRAVRTEEAGA